MTRRTSNPRRSRPRSARGAVAVLAAAALVFAACGGDDDDDDAADTTTTEAGDTDTSEAGGELTDLGHGVTADTIKIGIAIVDYTAIAEFVDFARGDQQAIAQVFVDDINENGGIGGRTIEPVYKTYPPIPGQEPSALSLCTAWTEDDEVFAVLGVFIDFSGDAQLCLTREHETIHIGHELEQPWIDESPGGLMLTPDTTKEAAAAILITLLTEEGTLEGKTVGILGDQNAEARVNDVITPGLTDAGAEVGSAAILTITDEDTTAAQAQLDSFIERWKSENVDTIFMSGLTASAKQFVQKIKAEMPDVLLIADAESTVGQAQDLAAAGTVPNPYEGMLGTQGQTSTERWANKNALLQQCADVYEEATGETIVAPEDLTPGPDGKTQEIYIAVTDFCGELQMFKTIAEKVGPELTNANWQKTVDAFGPIEIVPTDIASLCAGKYAADDAFRIVSYDSSEGEQGDWTAVTEIADASGGKCA